MNRYLQNANNFNKDYIFTISRKAHYLGFIDFRIMHTFFLKSDI